MLIRQLLGLFNLIQLILVWFVLFYFICIKYNKMSRKIDNLFDSITSTNGRFEKLLNNRGNDINALNREGNSLLYVAAEKNQIDKINFLLDNGADVNIRNERGATPLNAACDKNALVAVQLLIDRGADVNTRTNRGNTPLSCAASGKGCTLLNTVAFNTTYDFTNVAKVLLDNGADVNILNPLLMAARAGNQKMVQLLLANGANINATDNTGQNVLQIAQQEGHTNIVKFLKDYETVEAIHLLQNVNAGPDDPRSVYTMMDASSVRDLRQYLAKGKRKTRGIKTKAKKTRGKRSKRSRKHRR
jgi:ankyrin repeat protein